MDATLNNEQYVSGENVELLLEAAIMAAGEEAAQKERERRLRDQEKFTDKLQVAAKLLESEKSRVQQLMNAGHELQADYEQREARLQGEIRAIAEQEKAHDHEVVSSVAEIATGMFARWRFWIRAMSLLLVIPPIYLAIQAYSSGANGLWAVIVALGTALFAAATAMDRPGAWLSKLLHRRIESSIERRLRDLARGDLAERLRMEWKDGVASWSLTD